MKTCSACHAEKELSEFSKDKNRKDGLYTQCKSCVSTYWAKYYKKNYDKRITNQRKASKRWRVKNPEAKAADGKRWRENNKQKVCDYQAARRARIANNGVYVISDKELNKLYSSNCFYCGTTGKMTIDHIIPITRGGTHSIGNLVPACVSCNTSKSNKLLVEWRKV